MGKRKKGPVDVEGLKIEDVAAEGKSIAKIDDLVVFLPYGAPGDIVNAKINKKKKSYAEGYITKIVEPSAIRVEPLCSHFTLCGGCKWQHLPYEYQLKFKQKQVIDALQRIAKVEIPEVAPTIGSEKIYGYRNKLEYTFSAKRWLTFDEMTDESISHSPGAGFHIPGAFDKVLDIKKCHLQDDISNRIRLFVKSYCINHDYSFYNLREQHGFMRNLIVRTSTTGELMVIAVFGDYDAQKCKSLLDALIENFREIISLHYIVNTKVNDSISDQKVILFAGTSYIEEKMGELRYRISPKSFYQTNSEQAVKLYSVACDFAELTGSELVYDLYTGAGTIANFVARKARKVLGIEYVEDAIVDARINSEANGISNTQFFSGDMKDVLTDGFIAEHGHPDVMIIDPPRAGMHTDVVDVILRAKPERLVYVSCNPATQARDIALLDKLYKVEAVQPVDMFPHTHHVENVVKLRLR